MMSIEVIRAMARSAARKSRSLKQEPFHPMSIEDFDSMPPFPFPFLGTRCPKGWKRAGREWFVDSSGWGRQGEPALHAGQFIEQAKQWFVTHPACGFAVIEAGQCQVWVGAFEKIYHAEVTPNAA